MKRLSFVGLALALSAGAAYAPQTEVRIAYPGMKANWNPSLTGSRAIPDPGGSRARWR